MSATMDVEVTTETGALTVPEKAKAVARIKPYTKQQAEEATKKAVATKSALRTMILELFERKAHKALGYTDDMSGFRVYLSERIGEEQSPRALNLQLQAAKVSSVVGEVVPIAIARQIGVLSTEKQIEAYEELKASGVATQSAAKMEPQARRIVSRYMAEDPTLQKSKAGRKRDKTPPAPTHDAPASHYDARSGLPALDSGFSTPSANGTGYSEQETPADREWTLDDWQIELGGLPGSATDPSSAYDALFHQVQYLKDFLYEDNVTERDEEIAGVFYRLVGLANAAGISLAEVSKGFFFGSPAPVTLIPVDPEEVSEDSDEEDEADQGEFSDSENQEGEMSVI